MLPAEQRLRDSASFRRAIKGGRRSGSDLLVVHVLTGSAGGDEPAVASRAGLVVSRAVGNAVTRNRVKRRLRHLLRDELSGLPPASVVVVRALPPAADASAAELRDQLTRCLSRATRRSAAA